MKWLVVLAACGGAQVNGGGTSKVEPEAAAPPPAAPEARFVDGGGRVIEVPVKGAVGVAFRIAFYTGSIDDPKGKEGLTHLTARLIAEGGTAKVAYADLLRALYPMAASIDVQVDKEQTVFSGLVHPDHAKSFVPILADLLKTPRFDPADFARVKQNAENDVTKRLRATDDENFGKELLGQMLYKGDHPYRHYVGGTVKGLAAITLDDAKAHAARVFGKQRMLIGVGGAVTPETVAAVKEALAGLPEGDPRSKEIMAPAVPRANEILIAEKPSSQAVAISIGYPHFATRGHEDWPALSLIQSYFGEHRQFHGVLMSEIREKRGMNYGDYAYVEAFTQEGWSRYALPNVARRRQHFEIWIRPVAPQDAIFALRMTLMLLDRLVRTGVDEKAVNDTREFLDGYTRLFEMTPMRRLGYALDDDFYGTSRYLEGLRGGMASLDAAKVNAALRRHLVPGPVHIAIVAPNAQAIVEAINAGVESPKAYTVAKPEEVLALDREAQKWPLAVAPGAITVIRAEDAFVE
jgi:zinc protease